MEKQIYILSFNGFWDPDTKSVHGTQVIDFTTDENGNPVHKHKPISFHTIQRWRIKKQTGKRNSITRPFVYADVSCTTNTRDAWDKYRAKHAAMMAELNVLLTDKLEYLHLEDNAEAYYMVVMPKSIRIAAGNILKKYGFENVYTQVKGTKYYSSYTPDDIQNSFIKLC